MISILNHMTNENKIYNLNPHSELTLYTFFETHFQGNRT